MGHSQVISALAIGLFVILLTPFQATSSTRAEEIRVLKAVAPIYPKVEGATDPSGRVDVSLQISASGDVLSARAINGHPLLHVPAERAAKLWRFTPSTGGASARTVLISFIFRTMPKDTPAEEISPIFSPPYEVEIRRLIPGPSNNNPSKSGRRSKRYANKYTRSRFIPLQGFDDCDLR
jgi:hypothetical protein